MRALYAVSWTEYERGWGQRPDGISFHKDKVAADAFVKRILGDRSGDVPDEYSSPNGPPQLVEVSQELFDWVHANGDHWSFKINRFTQAMDPTLAPPPKVIEWPLSHSS